MNETQRYQKNVGPKLKIRWTKAKNIDLAYLIK
jgi:hypothetical protein